MQYKLSKRNLQWKPSLMFSFGSRQNSGSLSVFQPKMDEIKQIFDKFDCDKDGKISKRSTRPYLALQKERQKMLEVADLDGDGFIDFKVFVEVQKKGGGLKTMDIQCIFDLNGDGKISIAARKACGDMQPTRLPENGESAIDMDEFLTVMTKSSKL